MRSLLIAIAATLFTSVAQAQDWPIFAGQHNEVGIFSATTRPSVMGSGGYTITANYQITEPGWCMSEVHLYIGEQPPTTAAPGRFSVKEENLGCVRAWGTMVETDSPNPWVAAHAVVMQFDSAIGSKTDYVVSTDNPASYLQGTLLPQEVTYPSWCYDLSSFITPGRTYEDCALISSLDPDAPVDKPENLDLANYLLNHESAYRASPLNATTGEIQSAIWRLIDFKYRDLGRTDIIENIVADVAAKGENYHPVANNGSVIAIIVDCGNDVQRTVVVVPVGNVGEETAWAQMMHPFKQGWGSYGQVIGLHVH